jgi:CubicO group peptidase (beta-lactamase class C family)
MSSEPDHPAARCALRALLAAALLVLAPALAAAEPDGGAADEVDAPAPVAVDPPRPEVAALGPPAAIDAWLDGVVETQRRIHHVPGAVVALVDREGTVLLRGWGYADLPDRRRVDPERTLFRLGSVTKTFVWAALMAEVTAGRLDLDADVDALLPDLDVPAVDGRPVTLADLMMHAAGFEDRGVDLALGPDEPVPPLAEHLADRRPETLHPPGLVPAYSNYGTALAAHVLETVTGEDWARHVERTILAPAGMEDVVADQPPADADRIAVGHRWRRGAFETAPFLRIPDAPAGALSGTATDLARWLRVHLGDGVVDGRRVLTAETVRRMQEPLRRFHPQAPPVLHGFYRMDRGGERVLGHQGSTMTTHTVLAILPDRGIGLFAAYNGDGGASAPIELLGALVERLAPTELPEPRTPPEDFAERADRYTGEYLPSRRDESSLARAGALVAAVRVAATADGHLLTRFPDGDALQWVEVAPDEFRARDGLARASFRATADGGMELWFSTDALRVLQRADGLASPALHRLGFTIAIAVLLLAFVGYPAAGLRSGDRMVFGQVRRLPPVAVPLAWGTAATGLVGLVLIGLSTGAGDAFVTGVPAAMVAALWTNALFAVLAGATLLVGLVCAFGDGATPGQRGRLLVVALAAVLHAGLLAYWNLMPWGIP